MAVPAACTDDVHYDDEGVDGDVLITQDDREPARNTKGLKIIIGSSVCFALGIFLALVFTMVYGPPQKQPHAGIVSSVPMCADVGTRIMRFAGGSAMDAAVAVTLCAGVVQPFSSGIGGGALILIRKHKMHLSDVIDGREVAPLDATRDMFNSDPDEQRLGVRSIAVPGELKALAHAHELYGSLSWKEVVMPAVNIARHGFNVSKSLAKALKEINPDLLNSNFAKLYFPDGKPLQEGTLFKNPHLAETLKMIAVEGVDVFYHGEVGQTMAREIAAAYKGGLTAEDLRIYKAISRKPLTTTFTDFSIETVPSPGGGPNLLFLLNFMEGYLGENKTVDERLFYHRLIEGIKISQGLNIKFGDPDFNEDMHNMTQAMISKEFAKKWRDKISDQRTQEGGFYGNSPLSRSSVSAQVSVIGPNEDHISISSSINSKFGSLFMTSNGIILNNHMADFDLPTEAQQDTRHRDGNLEQMDKNRVVNNKNLIEPGKRPLSALTPTITTFTDHLCRLRVVLGGINGTAVTSGVLEVLMNIMVFKKSINEAIQAPRLSPLLGNNMIEVDANFPSEILTSLREKGHNVFVRDKDGVGEITALAKANETFFTGIDGRFYGQGSVF